MDTTNGMNGARDLYDVTILGAGPTGRSESVV